MYCKQLLYGMSLNWILVLFFTCRMYGSFFYKCVVEINVIQMQGFNNVITGYRLISKPKKNKNRK